MRLQIMFASEQTKMDTLSHYSLSYEKPNTQYNRKNSGDVMIWSFFAATVSGHLAVIDVTGTLYTSVIQKHRRPV